MAVYLLQPVICTCYWCWKHFVIESKTFCYWECHIRGLSKSNENQCITLKFFSLFIYQ